MTKDEKRIQQLEQDLETLRANGRVTSQKLAESLTREEQLRGQLVEAKRDVSLWERRFDSVVLGSPNARLFGSLGDLWGRMNR